MAIYVGTYEGHVKVEGPNISGAPIHIICKPHEDSEGAGVKSVNFPINLSLLEITDNFSPAESHSGLVTSKNYRSVLRDIFHRQRVDAPVIALFAKSDLSPGCFLCSDCVSDRVYVARSSDKYVLEHITMFGKDFKAEL